MKVLQTQRLTLHRFTLDDAPIVLRLVNDPSFIQNIGNRGVSTIDDARRYLEEKFLSSYRDHGFGLYLVRLIPDKSPIGMCGLVKRIGLNDVDIGFALLPEYWGQGYAFESSEAVVEHARALGLKRLAGITSANNGASIRLLEKLGFHFLSLITLPGDAQPVKLYVRNISEPGSENLPR